MTDVGPKPRGFSDPQVRARAQATIAARRAKMQEIPLMPRAPKMPEPSDANDFPGLTAKGCAQGCSPKGCVISGKPYCAHPNKGGLQSTDMYDSAAVERFGRARKMLAHQATEARE